MTKYAYGNPNTDDLISVVNEVSEKDLTWFFKQWVLSAGHPQLDIESSYKDDILTLHVNQTQVGRKTPTKYMLPAKVAFYYKNEVIVEDVLIDRKRSIHRFEMNKEPLFVRFDPENDLLIEVNQKLSLNALINKVKRDIVNDEEVVEENPTQDYLNNYIEARDIYNQELNNLTRYTTVRTGKTDKNQMETWESKKDSNLNS